MKKFKYPSSLEIGDAEYKVVWVKSFKCRRTMGECDPGDYEIRIKKGMSKKDTLETFIHEVMHAFDFEGNLKLPHASIYAAESIIAKFLLDNFL